MTTETQLAKKHRGNVEYCDNCKSWTKYNNMCAVCQIAAFESEDNLKYRGMYEYDLYPTINHEDDTK